MGRYNECLNCIDVIEFRDCHRNKRDLKKVKCYEYKNPCSNQKVSGKRPRMTESETLHADGHGGRIRRDIYSDPSPADMPTLRVLGTAVRTPILNLLARMMRRSNNIKRLCSNAPD